MSQIGVWSISPDGPICAAKTHISLERDLEDWIERDPDLLSSGLTIVGRQITLEGVRLDLLGITPEGQWVCIELKAGTLYRDALSQALDYASLISRMPGEELIRYLNRLDKDKEATVRDLLEQEEDDRRDLLVTVVGTAADPRLERIVTYLSEGFQLPIRIVTFDVFKTADGTELLLRETSETVEQRPKKRRESVEAVRNQAIEYGSIQTYDAVLEAGRRLDLHLRPWKTSVTLNPKFKRSMTLIYARPMPDGRIRLGYSEPTLTDLYPLSTQDVEETIGRFENWADHEAEAVHEFIAQMQAMFARLDSPSDETA